jgi:hypothetical protein
MTNEIMFSSELTDWGTPACVLDRVLNMDRIILDPCHGPNGNVPAEVRYTEDDDGLSRSWFDVGGLVYMNPPYKKKVINKWVEKSVSEWRLGAEIIALVPARVETQWFREYWDHAAAICFWSVRIKFVGPSDNGATFPSAMVYLGDRVKRFEVAFRDAGKVIRL